MAADEVLPRAYAPILSSGTVILPQTSKLLCCAFYIDYSYCFLTVTLIF